MRKYLKLKLDFNDKIQSYICGFILSILLTIIPFVIVKNQYFSYLIDRLIIVLCAFMQIVVHFIYFLHLNSNFKKNYWYLTSLLFILIIIFIVVFGSIWIMFNLNHHVMI